MKKTLIVTLALGVTLVAASAFAQNDPYKNVGGNGIVGTSHDLSGAAGYDDGFADTQSRICVYCHHPHNATQPADAAGYSPLWNRKITSTSFTAYSNGVMMGDSDGTELTGTASTDTAHMMNGVPAVGGVSILCMSCHDGVTALNAFSQQGNSTGSFGGSATGNALTGSAAFTGNDLSNHHPIGMIWNDVFEGDDEIAGKTKTFNATSGITIADTLSFGKMECVTCHDVHNTQNPGAERFLWTSNDGSEFCLVCHLKAAEKQAANAN